MQSTRDFPELRNYDNYNTHHTILIITIHQPRLNNELWQTGSTKKSLSSDTETSS